MGQTITRRVYLCVQVYYTKILIGKEEDAHLSRTYLSVQIAVVVVVVVHYD